MAYLFCYKYKQEKLQDTIQVYFQLYNERRNEIATYIVKKEDFTPSENGGRLVKLVSIDYPTYYPKKITLNSVRIEIKNASNQFYFFNVPRDNIQDGITIKK